ncbi:uncharacterized protein [Diadema setosum]|uniref:uncharacterized protein n=1 Tax=Diadema setosum TaxID=31175 RepID=UPI003B3ABB84
MRKAMSNATFRVKWNDNRLTDLDFADDLTLLGNTAQSLQEMTDSLTETAAKVNGQTAEEVSNFTYLGRIISKDGDTELDITCRLGKARSVFQRLRKLKVLYFKMAVVPRGDYNCSCNYK